MRFDCFGTTCGVWGDGAADAHRQLERWHTQFTRFEPDERALQAQRRPARDGRRSAPTMARLLKAIAVASDATGGLVDGTLASEIEAAGYTGDLQCRLPLDVALTIAPPRAPARPRLTAPLHAPARRRPASGSSSARPEVRLRRPGQGPVRRPDRGADDRRLRGRLRRRPALRRLRPPARGHRPVRRTGAARVRGARRRRRDERHRQAQLARRRRPPRAPPTRPLDRPPGVHRRGPGDRARPHRPRGGVAREGRRAVRRSGLARDLRRRARARRRLPPSPQPRRRP